MFRFSGLGFGWGFEIGTHRKMMIVLRKPIVFRKLLRTVSRKTVQEQLTGNIHYYES